MRAQNLLASGMHAQVHARGFAHAECAIAQCAGVLATMASTEESEEWATEEEVEAPEVSHATSSTTLRDPVASTTEEEEVEEPMATAEPPLPSSQEEEDGLVSGPTSEDDTELLQTAAEATAGEEEEEEDGYEAAGEDDDPETALELEEEEEEEGDEGERSGVFDESQEATASASETGWDSDGEQERRLEEMPVPSAPQQVEIGGEGREEERLVTQRDEEIENYQSTIKELTAAVIEREQKLGAHQLELLHSNFAKAHSWYSTLACFYSCRCSRAATSPGSC